ncbi:tetratricopeptide repeat protein [Ostertagia ostertagi]
MNNLIVRPFISALRIFRHIGDVSMGLALESIVPIEEKTLLAAHVSMLLGRYDQAEQLFLKSSCPNEALAVGLYSDQLMRRDLLDWSKALSLAEQLAPSEIPYISREYAQQLEFMGDYPSALAHYEHGIIENPDEETEQILEHNEVCRSGLARMSIRTGDIRKGIQLARDLHGRVVKRDCAIILEQLKQYGEAADLYEIGQFYDRAAAVCLKAKAWGKVGELLPKVRSPKIHAQYGKIMEAEKRYKEAAVAYRNARDYDNLVRMLLDHLNMAEEAVKVVRESRSVEGAKLVANANFGRLPRFFSQLGDHASAIRFLVLSNCHQEAFQLAETTDHMAEYADSIEADGATQDQMAQLAEHFAGVGDAHNAGRFYLRAGHYRAALEYLMACGENHESLVLAIECVAAAGDSKLTARLTDFLMGEVDEIPKDAKYLFRLYVALGMTREAATTAVVIARQEQERGSYTIARNVLLAMYQELVAKQIKVPYDMQNSLMIIHSYLIVKSLLKRNETLRAARMLIRTTANISRFPAHVVPILTSAVVVCSKAGLKSAAHRAAVQLMQPEYRQKIDVKYKKKIEALVRRADKADDADETRPPCPHCAYPVPETVLACDNCKSTIPYCIITGRHIVDSDFAQCPSCNFPGYYSEFKKLLALNEVCPMCSSSLKDVMPADASAYLKSDKTNSEQVPS